MRYVRNCQAIEKLLEFVQCDDVKGASIAEFIINALNNAVLYPQMCRAQTHMEPVIWQVKRGAGAKFCSETGNEKAVYFQCASHELNLLCLKHPKSCKL